jgi:hypothetical protein
MTKLSKTQTILLTAFIALNLVIFITLFQTFEITKQEQPQNDELKIEVLEPVNQLLEQYEYNQAIDKLNQIINEDPQLTEAYLLLKNVLLKYNKDQEAEQLLNKAISNNVSDDRILLALADIKYEKGDWASARDLYFLLYEKDPSNSEITRKYADSLILLNEDEKLQELSAKIDPYVSSEMRLYKNILSYSFNTSETELLSVGIEDLNANDAVMLETIKDLNIDPSQNDSYILGLSQTVYELMKNSYLELALHFDRKLIDENSFFEKPNLYAASIFMQLNSPEHAQPHILRCLKYNPESLPCHILMVEYYYATQEIDKLDSEITMLMDLLSANSQDQVFALLAIFDKNKDYSAVIDHADAILKKAPNYYREIDFLALKAAFLSKDQENIDKFSKKVAQFELVLTASERSLFLSSKYLLLLNSQDVITSEQVDLIQNIDALSIYPQLFLYTYYEKFDNMELMSKAKTRALELDFNMEIPETFFMEIVEE